MTTTTTPADPCAAERGQVAKLTGVIEHLCDAIYDELSDLDLLPSAWLAQDIRTALETCKEAAHQENQ